jgi:predicted dehydrogenase
MGMIGGGKNAFIGAIHRIAANMDGLIELHCGAFSSNPQTSIESGRDLFSGIKSVTALIMMLVTESKLPLKERMDFVSIVTPPTCPAIMALEYGFNVLIDKPMTLTLDEAKHLQRKVKKLAFCLSHTYSGIPW